MSCLGTAQPVAIAFQTPYAQVPVGPASGYFVLDFATTFSSIDLGAFPAPGPSTSGCDPTHLGAYCTVADFTFFAPPASVTLVTEDFSGLSGWPRQAGIIGTDFLSEDVFTIDYANGQVFAASSDSFCTDDTMLDAGYRALSTAGFYQNDLSLLGPLASVKSGAAEGIQVPNVPTVPVRIAGALAVAQLDTGFDDAVTKFSININEAFYTAIVADDPSALVRDTTLDMTLSTCVGINEPVEGYRLAPGGFLDFVGSDGAPVRSYPDAAIFVKRTPAAAASCGGIGTWTAPAAQVAASYFIDFGTLVVDPFRAQVWVPSQVDAQAAAQ